MDSLIGQQLGQYEILELLGQGGMASVYKAHQASIGRDVAIKVLSGHHMIDDQFVERFHLEAKTIGSLQHPHILPLYDYGQQDDVLYLAMSYIDGGTLEDLLYADKPLTTNRIEKLIREVASALDYAHRHGVIHRDIKPANILIDSDGHALLADFGIVKMVGSDANLTGTGVIGTPAYIAPEQGQGELDIDGRADLYSLACVAYQMFTGQQPYRADTVMKVVLKHITDPVPSLLEFEPDLPVALDKVLQKGMAKEPSDRHSSAVEFAEEMTRALHSNEDSMVAAKAAVPLSEPTQPSGTPTTKLESPVTSTDPQLQSNPTIIVQQTTNPLLFMGLFGIIALVIVVVAIVMVGQQNQNEAIANATDSDNAQIASDSTPEPTDVPIVANVPDVETFGELRYNTTEELGDTINLTVEDVDPPTDGNSYVVWLKNTATEDVINIGEIVIDATGRGILIYTDEEARMLPSLYNNVVITEESSIDGDLPEGDAIYTGSVPVELSQALLEIFVTSPEGFGEMGLLFSARNEARTAQNHAGLAARARSIGSVKLHAEHTLNILNGTEEDYDGNGEPQNPGRGIGVFFFLDRIDELLLDVVQNDEASIYLQQNAEFILVCTQNVRDWANVVQELELQLIASETLEDTLEVAAESQTISIQMTSGFDLNEDGRVEEFEGECGIDQIPGFGIQVANIDIVQVETE